MMIVERYWWCFRWFILCGSRRFGWSLLLVWKYHKPVSLWSRPLDGLGFARKFRVKHRKTRRMRSDIWSDHTFAHLIQGMLKENAQGLSLTKPKTEPSLLLQRLIQVQGPASTKTVLFIPSIGKPTPLRHFLLKRAKEGITTCSSSSSLASSTRRAKEWILAESNSCMTVHICLVKLSA